MKLRERFLAEKSNLSYADLHHEITRDAKDEQPDTLENKDKRRITRIPTVDDELVKYMSNLPKFLERGANIKERAFNVGVLDWGRLEKWQHSHKQIIHRTSRYSTSSSSASSSFSTEGSSSHSSRGRSCSPVHQRVQQPTLRIPRVANARQNDQKTALSKSEGNNNVPEMNQTLNVHSQGQGEESKRRDEMASCSKEGTEVKACMIEKKVEQSQESTGRPNTIVLLLPRNIPGKGHSEVSRHSDSDADSKQKSTGAGQRSHLGESAQLQQAKSFSNVPHSCPLPRDFVYDSRKQHMSQPTLTDTEKNVSTSEVFCPAWLPSRISVSPSRNRTLERKGSTSASMNIDAVITSKGFNTKASKVSSEKPRSSSPFRRISVGVGKIVKSSSSKEQSSSTQTSADADYESAVCIAGIGPLVSTDKVNATSRARSSPLRRLLDPILKAKASNTYYCDEPYKRSSAPNDEACKSSTGRSESPAVQPAKAKLDLTGCHSIDVDNSHLDRRIGSSSTVQALLRVAFKNGLPLFTFAVDNDGDILAATVKEGSSLQKDNSSWIYTFFAIRQVKKKNGSWMTYGGKSKGQDYIPNVIAQMRVSDTYSSNVDKFHSREFVLFSADTRQNQSALDFDDHPNDELAAIVSRVPMNLCQPSVKDGYHSSVKGGISEVDKKGFNTTVILPGGVHSLPSKGEPYPLVQRWKSGGSCDCGGWDPGCRFKVLSGHHQTSQRLGTKATSSTDQFSLFPQVDAQEQQPAFVLAPFKDGIYSVEFNPFLSVLQAFSVCIAVLDSRKMIEHLEGCNSSKEKSSDGAVQVQNGATGIPSRLGDLPAKYVSNPPLSPVGRV